MTTGNTRSLSLCRSFVLEAVQTATAQIRRTTVQHRRHGCYALCLWTVPEASRGAAKTVFASFKDFNELVRAQPLG